MNQLDFIYMLNITILNIIRVFNEITRVIVLAESKLDSTLIDLILCSKHLLVFVRVYNISCDLYHQLKLLFELVFRHYQKTIEYITYPEL